MSYRVYISDHAARDLHAIYEHIAFHLQAPLNARKQLSRLEDAIYSLDIFPERHPRYTKGAWRHRMDADGLQIGGDIWPDAGDFLQIAHGCVLLSR